MLSQRLTAQLGLAAAILVLVASVTILLHGREGLRGDPAVAAAADHSRTSSPLVSITPRPNH